jgi:hypothetical protein
MIQNDVFHSSYSSLSECESSCSQRLDGGSHWALSVAQSDLSGLPQPGRGETIEGLCKSRAIKADASPHSKHYMFK